MALVAPGSLSSPLLHRTFNVAFVLARSPRGRACRWRVALKKTSPRNHQTIDLHWHEARSRRGGVYRGCVAPARDAPQSRRSSGEMTDSRTDRPPATARARGAPTRGCWRARARTRASRSGASSRRPPPPSGDRRVLADWRRIRRVRIWRFRIWRLKYLASAGSLQHKPPDGANRRTIPTGESRGVLLMVNWT